MIIIKLVLFVAVCYIISKGLVVDYELKMNSYKEELEVTKEKVKNAYFLMQEEKTLLIDTINDLRLELNQYKNKR